MTERKDLHILERESYEWLWDNMFDENELPRTAEAGHILAVGKFTATERRPDFHYCVMSRGTPGRFPEHFAKHQHMELWNMHRDKAKDTDKKNLKKKKKKNKKKKKKN